MFQIVRLAVLVLALVTTAVLAHPGEKIDHANYKRQAELHRRIAVEGAQALQQCAGTLEVRQFETANIARRHAVVQELRKTARLPQLGTFFSGLIDFT
jgi:hypothetical protein